MEKESIVVLADGSFQLFIPLPEIGNCDFLVVFCERDTVIVLFELCCSLKGMTICNTVNERMNEYLSCGYLS
jgi:hypothetical protein